MDRTTHIILKTIIVGRVFTVDVHINAKLENKAKIYSHHHCFPNKSPGKIIKIFVMKAQNSIKLGFVQYSFLDIEIITVDISLGFIINMVSQIFIVGRTRIYKFFSLRNFIPSHSFVWLYIHYRLICCSPYMLIIYYTSF